MDIQLKYRKTSRLSMRIVKNGDVHVSAPYGMPQQEIEAFVEQHREWIDKARQKTAERQKRQAEFYKGLRLDTYEQKYRAEQKLIDMVEPMVRRYSNEIGVYPTRIEYKIMTSKWGMCNVRKRTICFSIYLLLLPTWCIDHVVVHELCHLIEPSHSARFHALMDKYFPLWKEARKETRKVALDM